MPFRFDPIYFCLPFLFLLTAAGVIVLSSEEPAGRLAYENGDYAVTLEIWRPLAGQGDPEAKRPGRYLCREELRRLLNSDGVQLIRAIMQHCC